MSLYTLIVSLVKGVVVVVVVVEKKIRLSFRVTAFSARESVFAVTTTTATHYPDATARRLSSQSGGG